MTPLREIEEWTGHKQPHGEFPWVRVLLVALVGLGIAILLQS